MNNINVSNFFKSNFVHFFFTIPKTPYFKVKVNLRYKIKHTIRYKKFGYFTV